MQSNILSVAKGYDLSAAFEELQTVLDATNVEALLIQASKISEFEIRNMRTNFTADISAAETESGVDQIIQDVLTNVDNFRAGLTGEVERILNIARENPNLADRVAEAEDESAAIGEKVNKMFDDAFAEGEV